MKIIERIIIFYFEQSQLVRVCIHSSLSVSVSLFKLEFLTHKVYSLTFVVFLMTVPVFWLELLSILFSYRERSYEFDNIFFMIHIQIKHFDVFFVVIDVEINWIILYFGSADLSGNKTCIETSLSISWLSRRTRKQEAR